jgi:hypothetical protein
MLNREVHVGSTFKGFSSPQSNSTKEIGSELAVFLPFVIMFYTQGNANTGRWEVMIRTG